MKGTDILNSFPSGSKGMMRAVLDAFNAGYLVSPVFKPITMTGGGHTVQVWVATDALHLGEPGDSFRPMISPLVEQMVADSIGLYLPTAKVVREAYKQADIKVEPKTQEADSAKRKSQGLSPDMSDRAAMIKHNQDVDKGAGFSPGAAAPSEQRIYSSGKGWINDKKLPGVPGMGCNHGWYTKSAPYSSFEGLKLWQDRGTKHNIGTNVDTDPGHYDYSQTASELVYPWVLVDGKDWMDWAVVLGDPVLSKAVNDDGPLPTARPHVLGTPSPLPTLPKPISTEGAFSGSGAKVFATAVVALTFVGLIMLSRSI